MHPTIIYFPLRKARFFILGITTNLGEGKLCTQISYALQNLHCVESRT